jgi:hypothetical protein
MATTSKTLFRGAAATTNTTLYTVPTISTTTVVTSIAVANTAAAEGTFTINIDGVAVLSAVSLAANSTAVIDMKQVLDADATPKIISGSASAITINFHISGVEIV